MENLDVLLAPRSSKDVERPIIFRRLANGEPGVSVLELIECCVASTTGD
jgi:hypothetical protein